MDNWLYILIPAAIVALVFALLLMLVLGKRNFDFKTSGFGVKIELKSTNPANEKGNEL